MNHQQHMHPRKKMWIKSCTLWQHRELKCGRSPLKVLNIASICHKFVVFEKIFKTYCTIPHVRTCFSITFWAKMWPLDSSQTITFLISNRFFISKLYNYNIICTLKEDFKQNSRDQSNLVMRERPCLGEVAVFLSRSCYKNSNRVMIWPYGLAGLSESFEVDG